MAEDAEFGEALGPQRRHEILGQDVGDEGADGAGDDAHGDDAHGNGRQNQVAEMGPVRLPFGRSAGPGAGGRQPVELHREDDDQHHAQPVVRHGHADHREDGGDLVDRAVAEIAGDEAEQQAEEKADEGRNDREQQRVLHRPENLAQDRAAGGDGGPEVALQGTPAPQNELLVVGTVEPVGLHHLLLELLGRIRRQDGDQRVAGRDMDEGKTDDRNADDDRDRVDEAFAEID
ncbi:MAG: hypothetical protein FD152_4433 [Xanthobacteraceae bacterium]|nr:MAG: hypothetical protein FD152_4433 [Xanthobacteraceae bacterium]